MCLYVFVRKCACACGVRVDRIHSSVNYLCVHVYKGCSRVCVCASIYGKITVKMNMYATLKNVKYIHSHF